jgi:N-acetylglutamate synthase-like GNAT family acetyltransferase
VVGAAAVELYADGAPLRSVVVDPMAQGQGLGHRLSDAALSIAKDRGTHTAFLLTTTAGKFYIRSPNMDQRNKPAREVFMHFFGLEVTWK